MTLRRNSEVGGLVAGIVMAVAGGLLMVLPFVLDMDMMGGGYALLTVGLFLVVTGLITAAVFWSRVARLQAIFAGKNLLAQWVYSPLQVQAQAGRDLEQARAANRARLLLVTGLMLACIVLFAAYGYLSGEGDSMPAFIGLMLGVLAVVAAFAFLVPVVQHRRALRSSGEALIAANGLYINGALHTWNAPLAGLDGVSLLEDGDPSRLVFHLRTLSRANATLYESYTVEVPVPPGELEKARQVEAYFRPPAA